MHVVSTSMSRRDLNFPTLGAPYRTPVPLPSRSRSRAAATVAPRSLDATFLLPPPPSRHKQPRGVARALFASTCMRVNAGGHHQHARACPSDGRVHRVRALRAFQRATTHDFSPMPTPGPHCLLRDVVVCVRTRDSLPSRPFRPASSSFLRPLSRGKRDDSTRPSFNERGNCVAE